MSPMVPRQEIITFNLSGALEQRGSMGNGSIIRPWDVQRMSPGTGDIALGSGQDKTSALSDSDSKRRQEY